MRDDLVAFLIERGNPVVDARAAMPASDLRDFKQIPHLSIRELGKEIGEKSSARFADVRIAQRARVRPA